MYFLTTLESDMQTPAMEVKMKQRETKPPAHSRWCLPVGQGATGPLVCISVPTAGRAALVCPSQTEPRILPALQFHSCSCQGSVLCHWNQTFCGHKCHLMEFRFIWTFIKCSLRLQQDSGVVQRDLRLGVSQTWKIMELL